MLVIRPETNIDYQSVYDVVQAAFSRPDEADLVARLRPLPETISLIGEANGEIVAHIAFSRVTLHDEQGHPSKIKLAGLAPVSVRPDVQNSGYGGRLIMAGLEACRQAGFVGCFLLGIPTYYPRFGFQPALSTFGITSTYEVPDPVFMGMELVEGALAGLSGTIYYHPTFNGM